MENLNLQQLEWLFYLLLGVILLIVILLIVYVLRTSRRRTEMARAQLTGTPAQPTKTAPQPHTPEGEPTVALVRAQPGGVLMVEIDGVRYQRLADIEEAEVRRQVLSTALDLIRFTGVMGEEELSPAPLETTANWREDLRQESKDWLERAGTRASGLDLQPPAQGSSEDAEELFLRSLNQTPSSAPSLAPPTLVDAIRRRMRGQQANAEQSLSFVQDIERILQRRIQLLPALAGRDLHVRLASDGTVRFRFEGQDYADLDEVPNLTARQLVRDAIQEWDDIT
jgi:hypothetical protein